jgi:hypothetical protein
MSDTFQITTYAAGVVGVSEQPPAEDSDTTEEQE